jgi:hypothetical protein
VHVEVAFERLIARQIGELNLVPHIGPKDGVQGNQENQRQGDYRNLLHGLTFRRHQADTNARWHRR